MMRLKIRKHDDDSVKLDALEGIDHFGFGTFLLDIKPEEIDADQFSKDALLAGRPKSGLNGLEIWADSRIAWGDPSHSIIMPISEFSIHDGASKWLEEIEVSR